ncbi:MAG: putative Ig domain-containing protein [Bdellovibrionota bacterium]
MINVNDAPVWTQNPIELSPATEDAPYSFDLRPFASDEDGDALTFSKVSGPQWLKVDAQGRLSGTPPKVTWERSPQNSMSPMESLRPSESQQMAASWK